MMAACRLLGGAKQTPSGIDEGGALLKLDLGWLAGGPNDDDLLLAIMINSRLYRTILGYKTDFFSPSPEPRLVWGAML